MPGTQRITPPRLTSVALIATVLAATTPGWWRVPCLVVAAVAWLLVLLR